MQYHGDKDSPNETHYLRQDAQPLKAKSLHMRLQIEAIKSRENGGKKDHKLLYPNDLGRHSMGDGTSVPVSLQQHRNSSFNSVWPLSGEAGNILKCLCYFVKLP